MKVRVNSELPALQPGQALDVGGATLLVEAQDGGARPLGAKEREVLAAFTQPARRREWLAGRRAAKRVLFERFGIDPDRVEVLPDVQGRPEVQVDGEPRPELRLSLSHTGAWAAAACAKVALGVDLCRLSDGSRLGHLAPRVFSPGEAEAVGVFRSDERGATAWALKEACLKATGGGIFRPGSQSVRLLCLVPPVLERSDLSASAWTLPGAVLALAVER